MSQELCFLAPFYFKYNTCRHLVQTSLLKQLLILLRFHGQETVLDDKTHLRSQVSLMANAVEALEVRLSVDLFIIDQHDEVYFHTGRCTQTVNLMFDTQ